MKRYTASEARQEFADVLDEAERGRAVVIERRGVQFRLVAESKVKHKTKPAPIFCSIDSVVDSGQWTWDSSPEGLRFVPRDDE